MISLFGYSFQDNKACLICEHVFAGDQVRIAVHDEDGWLQFLCGADDHAPQKGKVVGLSEFAKRHDLSGLPAKLTPGSAAELQQGGRWQVFDIQEES